MKNRRILLVDDEAALADLLKRYLERIGYEVDTYTDAGTALAWVEKSPGRYALVIADLTLPDMSGAELIAKLQLSEPGLPALLTSGYPHEPSPGDPEFLQKPFLPKALAEMIARIMEPEPTGH